MRTKKALKAGVQSLISTLRQDSHALELVHVCIITYDAKAQVVSPLQSLEDFQMPLIDCHHHGKMHLIMMGKKLNGRGFWSKIPGMMSSD